jgi:hypothetical protein
VGCDALLLPEWMPYCWWGLGSRTLMVQCIRDRNETNWLPTIQEDALGGGRDLAPKPSPCGTAHGHMQDPSQPFPSQPADDVVCSGASLGTETGAPDARRQMQTWCPWSAANSGRRAGPVSRGPRCRAGVDSQQQRPQAVLANDRATGWRKLRIPEAALSLGRGRWSVISRAGRETDGTAGSLPAPPCWLIRISGSLGLRRLRLWRSVRKPTLQLSAHLLSVCKYLEASLRVRSRGLQVGLGEYGSRHSTPQSKTSRTLPQKAS